MTNPQPAKRPRRLGSSILQRNAMSSSQSLRTHHSRRRRSSATTPSAGPMEADLVPSNNAVVADEVVSASASSSSSSTSSSSSRNGSDDNDACSPTATGGQAHNNNNNHGAAGALEVTPNLGRIAKIVLEDLMKSDPSLVATALENLSDLLDSSAKDSEQNTDEAFKFGAHTMVIAQLRRWMNHPEVIMCGCFCLEKLAYMDQWEPHVIDAGGVEVVLTALRTYPHSVGVQYGGCRALKNMLSGDLSSTSRSTQQISKRFVQELNGIAAVKHAMTRFFLDGEIQAVGCDIFRFLGLKPQFRTAMLEAGVGGIVVKTMEHHWSIDQGVKETAMLCMEQLFSSKN